MPIRPRKVLLIVATGVALLLVGWLTFQSWAHLLAGHLLPEEWRIEQLDIERPGMKTVRVAGLTAEGRVGTLRIVVEASDLSVRYSGPGLSAGLLRITLVAGSGDRPGVFSGPLNLDELAIPRLLVPGGFPEMVIRRMELDTDLTDRAEYLVMDDLRLGRDTEEIRLRTGIDKLPLLAGSATLELALGAESLDVKLIPESSPASRPAVVFRQKVLDSSTVIPAVSAQASIEIDLGLEQLDVDAPVPWLEAVGLGDAQILSGNLTALARFEGEEQLKLQSARIGLDQVKADSGQGLITASGRADARVEGEAIEWRLEGFETRAEGALTLLFQQVREALESAGINIPPWDGATRLVVKAPGLIEGRLGARPPYPLKAKGGLTLDWRQEESGQLALVLSEIAWQSPAALELEGSSSTARVVGELDLDGPIGVSTETASLDMTHLKARFEGQIERDQAISMSGEAVFTGLRLPGQGLDMQRLDLKLENLRWPAGDGGFKATTAGLQWMVEGETRSGADLDVRGEISGANIVAGSGEILLGATDSLPFGFEADVEQRSGELRFEEAKLPATSLFAAARPLAITLPKNLSFNSGEIHLDGEIALSGAAGSQAIGGKFAISSDSLGLSLGETAINGLGFDVRLDLAETLAGEGNLEVEIIQLAAGMDVLATNSRFEIDGTDQFRILGLRAGLMDGTLESDELPITGVRIGDATIRWLGFDLGRLLAFMDVGGLDATGRIDARFPLISEPDGLAVRDGSFEALGPGRIRYSTGIPATNIGMQALENFEYETLEGTINYTSDGAFKVELDLLGKNPDLYGGHPIRFRLNLGGELPKVFRSMFITGDFEQAIIEQLRNNSDDWPGQP